MILRFEKFIYLNINELWSCWMLLISYLLMLIIGILRNMFKIIMEEWEVKFFVKISVGNIYIYMYSFMIEIINNK